jgi:hypothetical protein
LAGYCEWQYVALMTDAYPLFRLDQGADEPRPPDGNQMSSSTA